MAELFLETRWSVFLADSTAFFCVLGQGCKAAPPARQGKEKDPPSPILRWLVVHRTRERPGLPEPPLSHAGALGLAPASSAASRVVTEGAQSPTPFLVNSLMGGRRFLRWAEPSPAAILIGPQAGAARDVVPTPSLRLGRGLGSGRLKETWGRPNHSF